MNQHQEHQEKSLKEKQNSQKIWDLIWLRVHKQIITEIIENQTEEELDESGLVIN